MTALPSRAAIAVLADGLLEARRAGSPRLPQKPAAPTTTATKTRSDSGPPASGRLPVTPRRLDERTAELVAHGLSPESARVLAGQEAEAGTIGTWSRPVPAEGTYLPRKRITLGGHPRPEMGGGLPPMRWSVLPPARRAR